MTQQEALEQVRTVARDNMDAIIANPDDPDVAAVGDGYMHRVTKGRFRPGAT